MFGFEQAIRYRDGLKSLFSFIANNPYAYQAVQHIKPDYRRAVYQNHAIYYRVRGGDVLIVRVLGQQDLNTSQP